MKTNILFLFLSTFFACQSKKKQTIVVQCPAISIYPTCVFNMDSVDFYYPIKIKNFSTDIVFFEYSSNTLSHYYKTYNKTSENDKWVQIGGDTYQGRWRTDIQEFKLNPKEIKNRYFGLPRHFGDSLELIFPYNVSGESLHTRVFLEIKKGYIIRQLGFYEIPLDVYFEKKGLMNR
jgi:hypothetical protein